MYKLVVSAAAVSLILLGVSAGSRAAGSLQFESLDGSSNNVVNQTWGQSGTQYSRVASPNYADGISQMVGGPNLRYASNRIFNDIGQNIFSENDLSQMGWLWGQFVDHNMGLRVETPAESAPIAFNANDPLEQFHNVTGQIDFSRPPAAPGTGPGTGVPRQQINTVDSYIDGDAVYGNSAQRLDWLRVGTLDGDPTNNGARLMLPGNFLPYATARGDVSSAPPMDLMGPLTGNPAGAIVAGDVRANENIGLTAMQTLFAREHNRIVSQLPSTLSSELKFQIARRVVAAEIQYITYNEFLPATGVQLPAYTGYNPTVNASITNEFATVGFRAHSMVHGQMEPKYPEGYWTQSQLDAFQAQ